MTFTHASSGCRPACTERVSDEHGSGHWDRALSSKASTMSITTEAIKQFDGPDNITFNSKGLVVITEDGDNPCSRLAMSHTSKSVEFARDIADRGEFAGPCFNKSNNQLYVSVQGDCTYAITGPFGSIL